MALIKYATKEITAKIVYYGPGLSGKTTNLQYINQKKPGGKCGELLSLATEGDRTLFFDLLPMNVGMIAGFRLRFQLFTVPGQIFYNKTRKMVLRDSDGVVFVADSQKAMVERNLESIENLKDNLRENGLDYDTIPFVLQFNKRDLPNVLTPDEMSRDLNDRNAMVFEAVATTGVGILETLQHIMKLVLFDLDKKYNIYKPRMKESDEVAKSAVAGAPPLATRPAPAAPPPVRPVGVATPPPMARPVGMTPPPFARPASVGPTESQTHPRYRAPGQEPQTRPARPGVRGLSNQGTWDLTAKMKEAVEDAEVEEAEAMEETVEAVEQEHGSSGEREKSSSVLVGQPVSSTEEEGEVVETSDEELEEPEEIEADAEAEAGEEAEEEEVEGIQDLTGEVPLEEMIEEPAGARAKPLSEKTETKAEEKGEAEAAASAEAPVQAEPVGEPEEAPAHVPREAPSAQEAAAAPEKYAGPVREPMAPLPASVPAVGEPLAVDSVRIARLEEAYREISTKIDEFMMEFRDAFVEGKISRDKDKRDLLQAVFELRQTPDMMTAKEVAKYLSVSMGSIYQLANEGKIPCTRLEGRRKWIFPKALVDEWIVRKSKEE